MAEEKTRDMVGRTKWAAASVINNRVRDLEMKEWVWADKVLATAATHTIKVAVCRAKEVTAPQISSRNTADLATLGEWEVASTPNKQHLSQLNMVAGQVIATCFLLPCRC